jgi:polyhydroxyalkanoate synthesis regulator phasin
MANELVPRGELSSEDEANFIQRLSEIRRYGGDAEKGDESDEDNLTEEQIMKLLLDGSSFGSKEEVDEAVEQFEKSDESQ